MEAAVGEGATEPFVEEQKQECDIDALGGEAVGIALAVALHQPVTFQLAKVVAKLIQPVGPFGEVERGQDGLMNLPGRPAADGGAAVEQHLQEPDHARIVDLDAGGSGPSRP